MREVLGDVRIRSSIPPRSFWVVMKGTTVPNTRINTTNHAMTTANAAAPALCTVLENGILKNRTVGGFEVTELFA